MPIAATHDDIRNLAAKLDSLDLTEAEAALLAGVFVLAQEAGSDVEGFVARNPKGGSDPNVIIDIVAAGFAGSWLDRLGIVYRRDAGVITQSPDPNH
jgi:hypothetical protein